MGTTRTKFNPDFKAKVALAAIRGEMTINEIAPNLGCMATRSSAGRSRLMRIG